MRSNSPEEGISGCIISMYGERDESSAIACYWIP